MFMFPKKKKKIYRITRRRQEGSVEDEREETSGILNQINLFLFEHSNNFG